MAKKKIILREKTAEGYDELYPKTTIEQVENLSNILSRANLYLGVKTLAEINAMSLEIQNDPNSHVIGEFCFLDVTENIGIRAHIYAYLPNTNSFGLIKGDYLGIKTEEWQIDLIQTEEFNGLEFLYNAVTNSFWIYDKPNNKFVDTKALKIVPNIADIDLFVKKAGRYAFCKENNSLYICVTDDEDYYKFSVDDKINSNISLLSDFDLQDPQAIFFVRLPNGSMKKVSLGALITAAQDSHFKGFKATAAQLPPAGIDADWAIVGETDTIWIWDTDTGAWKNSGGASLVTMVNGQIGNVNIPTTKIVVAVDEPGNLAIGDFWYQVIA